MYSIILSITIIIFIYIIYNTYNNTYNKTCNKINVFTYWTGYKYPYIELCIETMKKNLIGCNLHILDEVSIKKYLPELSNDIKLLSIPQQTDIIRVELLYKYGGVWIDADTIIIKNPIKLFDIQNYDFVGFGNSYLSTENGYPKPSNGVMASRKQGELISKIKDKLEIKIKNINKNEPYFSYGKYVIWECINELLPKYNYLHHSSSIDGTRDKNMKWINTKQHISYNFDFKDLLSPKNVYFVMLENHVLSKTLIKSWDKSKILSENIFISKLFRKSI